MNPWSDPLEAVALRTTAIPAFWPAAQVRRTSVLPLAKTLAQAEFTSAEHCNHRRVEAAKSPESKQKRQLQKQLPFLFGGDNRTRICDLPRVRRTLYRLSYASILNG